MNDKTIRIFTIIAALIVVISSSTFIVDVRTRVLLLQMGEARTAEFAPGLHFKIPFIQTVRVFDGRVLTLDNVTENFLTKEKKNVEVDFYVKWRISDPLQYYRATGGQEVRAADRLSATVNRGLRDEFGSRTIQEAVTSQREAMMAALEKSAASKVKELGIAIVDVRIKSINLPSEVSGSVYDRMRAERTRVAADLRARGAEEAEKIRAEADRFAAVTLGDAYNQSQKIRGEGDAKAAAVSATAYGADPEFYRFYRSMSAYKDSLGGSNDVMVIEPNNSFFGAYKGAGR